MESNSYFSIRFESSTIIRNFRILTITNFSLKKRKKAFFYRMTSRFFTLATTPSNQQNQCYHWHIMAHQVLKLLQQKPQQCGAIKTVEII